MRKIKGGRKLQHWHYIAGFLMLFDALSILVAFSLGTFIRFDLQFSVLRQEYSAELLWFFSLYVPLSLTVYYVLRLYHSIWRFASFTEMKRIVAAVAICSFLSVVISVLMTGRLPISSYVFGLSFQLLLCCGVRFSYRYILLMRQIRSDQQKPKRNAMIIGAGVAGQMLERDARKSEESDLKICCFIDDNLNKRNRSIDQIPVVGDRNDILLAAKNYMIDVILFAIPSASAADKRDILNICQETGCEVRVLPSYISLASGNAQFNSLQNIRMEDLLGREPIRVNTDEILNSISDKTIMVTGGGGSIGSELCRQIASHKPGMLLIVDIYENNAYDIQQELLRKYPALNLKVLIASVRDSARIEQIFEAYRPNIVYHAAAHKHVPLMETSPCEAVKNNVFGTYKTARAALKYGAERFVLISTDKAVNPTNIMGATKRLCEMVVQSMNEESSKHISWSIPKIGISQKQGKNCLTEMKTQFVAVRFGNVLGSNGSVIPLFKKQIENGGPVTVTHPDIIRYFMTIQEAVSLVLEAGTYAMGGEIFVLDMGEPMKIDDLAKNLIRMSGKRPDVDIPIVYTGLRPGEKLYEEKLMNEEGLEKTENDLIHIGKPIEFDRNHFMSVLPDLYSVAMKNDEGNLIQMVNDLVGTYKPDWEHFRSEGISYSSHSSFVESEPFKAAL